MTFYIQPPGRQITLSLFVCLFVFSFCFRFFAEILFFAYFILAIGCLTLTPKVAPWHWLGSTVPIFPVAVLLGFTCTAVGHVSYRFIFIHDSCILLVCQKMFILGLTDQLHSCVVCLIV